MVHAGKCAAFFLVILVLGVGAGVRAQDSAPADDSAPVEASSAKQVSKFYPLGKTEQIRRGLDSKGLAISVNLVECSWRRHLRRLF